jgi:hypothetical protein
MVSRLSSNSAIGLPGGDYGFGISTTDGGLFGYSQLRFKIDGVTTYGVAYFEATRLVSLRYEVPDAPPPAPVPEPAIWGELIAGLGIVGATLRAQRRAGRRALADSGTV